MKISQAVSYGLHALANLARRGDNGLVPSHIIAQEEGISHKFLLKVLKPLVSANILLSYKGPNGGYRLLRPATEVSILEVIEAIDGPVGRGVFICEVGLVTARLNGIMGDVSSLIRDQLDQHSIATLI